MAASSRVTQISEHLKSPTPTQEGLPTLELSDSGVATITLSLPGRRNPLSLATLKQLESHLLSLNPGWKWSEDWIGLKGLPDAPTKSELQKNGDVGKRLGKEFGVNPAVGCIVIKAMGPVFSSGHDLKEFSKQDPEFQVTLFEQCKRTMLLMRRVPQPVVAVLAPGQRVTAAGLQLVSMCDMVLAHTSNEFQYSGVNISGWCMTPQFPNAHPSRSVATTYTLKLLLTGEWSPAKDALQAGLISEVYEKEERAKEVVEKLAGRNREALVLGKFSFWRANGGAGKEFEDRFQEITKLVLNTQNVESIQAGSRGFFKK